jgi:glycosyltransferase involved in cell wall biosynthesis
VIVIVVKPYVGFPNGTAATSRVTAYARGLAAAGEDVRVILLGPSEPDEARAVNLEVAGTFRGIPFEYTSVSPIKDPSLPVRRWRAVSSVLTAGRRIRELHACTGVDAVLLYSGSVRTGRYFARLCRSLGVTCALDLAEMPFHGLPPGARRDRRQQGYGRRLISRFDLVVAITRFLADYASPFLRDGAEAIVLPIMVDPEDFRPDAEQAADPRIVEYVGMLNERKDGVATLMTAFSRLAAEFPDTVLRLVGDSDDPRHSNVPEYQEKAARLGIEDRVDFTGQVRRDAIPGLLAESSVLVLARPRSQ